MFPSPLVIPQRLGESRSARRRARRRDRCEAWEYAEIVWVYFSFLDGGSPHKTSDQERLLRNALNSTWTSIHAEYAGYMHDEINRYIRLQSQHEPLSRGISEISELIKVVRNSSYTSSHSVEQLSRVAKNVVPSRMSLPEAAGIIKPESLAQSVPHGVEPPNPVKGCFKVSPDDLHAVLCIVNFWMQGSQC